MTKIEGFAAKPSRLPLQSAAITRWVFGGRAMGFVPRVLQLLLLSLALVFTTSTASAETRALFVGIGTYKYASEDGDFKNLKGAASDVAAMKAVLQQKYGLEPRQLTTLLDEQASRNAILTTLQKLITDANEGDQIIFYFSGHGALVSEGFAGGGDEADRIDETIVPYDSRGPDGVKDIRDDELRQLVAAASQKGVNIVTVFDSCNSGSATRNGFRNVRSRAAPKATLTQTAEPLSGIADIGSTAGAKGFHVHLASARDGEEALEAEENGLWRGDFTAALVKALHKVPAGASYRDVLSEVRLQLTESGLGRQHPRGEGELNRSFLGTTAVERRVFEARREADGSWRLLGGTIAGVAPGSTFALFQNATAAAVEGATALAVGAIASSTPTHSILRTDAPATSTTTVVYAREIERKFEAPTVRVLIRDGEGGTKSALQRHIAEVGTLSVVQSNPQLVLVPDSSTVKVLDPDGYGVAEFKVEDAQLAAKALGSYFALLQLRDAGKQPDIDLSLQSVRCDGPSCAAPIVMGAAPSDSTGEYRFRPGDCFRTVVKSREAEKRHVYLLHLGSDFSVSLIHPGEHDPAEADSPLEPRKSLAVPDVFCMSEQPGRDHFMLIATDTPVDLSVLQQNALATRGKPLDPLSRLLQQSRQATRGDSPHVAVQNWGVTLISAVTEPARKGAQ